MTDLVVVPQPGDPHTRLDTHHQQGDTVSELPKGFGRRNPHCSNCGDERGGPFGHEISECQYRAGMTAEELAKTMPPVTASRYWSVMIDRYFERELGKS